jgi:hypothetical protein
MKTGTASTGRVVQNRQTLGMMAWHCELIYFAYDYSASSDGEFSISFFCLIALIALMKNGKDNENMVTPR